MISSKFSIPDQDKELFRSIISIHTSSDFLPASDYDIELYGYGMMGSKGRYKKTLITDIDGVWNYGDQIFVGYIKALAEVNDIIRDRIGEIKAFAANICPENVDQTVDGVSGILREADVTKLQHDYACDHSIDDIYAPEWWFDCTNTIEKIDYMMFFISGSPNRAVKRFVSERMGEPEENVMGSVYNFIGGKFDSIDHLLYENKRPAALRILTEGPEGSGGWKEGIKGFSMVLSDEPGDVEMVRSYESILLLVEDEEVKDENVVYSNIPEFGEDVRVLPDAMMKIERAFCLYFGYSRQERELIFESALQFKKLCEYIRTERDEEVIAQIRKEIIESLTSYTDIAWKLFPLRSSKIANIIDKLKWADDFNEIKSLSSKLFERFSKYSPDAHIAEQLL